MIPFLIAFLFFCDVCYASSASASFDGTSDYVIIDNATPDLDGLSQGTIMIRFRNTFTASAKYFIGCQDATDSGSSFLSIFQKSNGDAIRMIIEEAGTRLIDFSTDNTFNDGVWHQLAYVVSGTGNDFYIDGATTPLTYATGNSSSTVFFSSVNNIDECTIGGRYDESPGESFSGNLSDVRVYNRALTAAEIQEAYLCYDSPTGGLVGQWMLWDNGSTALDTSDNKNDGTITGATTSNNAPILQKCSWVS